MEDAGGLFHFKKDHTQHSIKPEDYATKPLSVASKENQLRNEFFLYVLGDLHTGQGLCNLLFTGDDPDFVQSTVERVYPLILATATASEMPATRAFSQELVAYIAAFLPAAPYFRANDIRVACVCDDQYTATLRLERLQETKGENFKNYMTSKTHGWFWRWECAGTSDAAASPAPGAAAAAPPPRAAPGA